MKRIALAVAALLVLPGNTARAQIFPGETPAQIAARMAKLDSVDRARAAAAQDNVNNINNPNHPGGRALRAVADSILKASADKHKAEMAAERAAWKRCSKATRIGASERTVTAGCGKPDAVNVDISRYRVTSQWVYGSTYIYFERGRVTYIQLH